jgi:uncharacterized protein DUF6062
MPTSIVYDFIEACREPGCPVCRLEARTVERYIDRLFYESVNDIETRERLRASLGFCREHAWLAMDKKLGSALGFAIIYQDVIDNVLRELQSNSVPPVTRRWSTLLKKIPEQVSGTVKRVLYALTPQKHCLACQQRDKSLHIILSSLVENLDNAETITALKSSDGLCLPHLKKTFEMVRDPAAIDLLLRVHREKLESLRDELAEFIRKNDYRFKDEGFGTESDAWRRAVAKVIGTN